MPDGRKFGSSDEMRFSSVSPLRPEPSSVTFARKMPCTLITLQLRKLSRNSSGHARLDRYAVPGHGREGRFQNAFMFACDPSVCPLNAGAK